jgi:ATP-dependent Zn protease
MDQPSWLMSLIVSWLPFVVLIVVWVLLSRRMALRPGRIAEHLEAQIAEAQRTNALLERIAVALESRAKP